jgi:hypothetical protein
MMRTLRHILELLQLTLPFPLRTGDRLLCDLSDKALFELKEAPCLGAHLVTSLQANQQEIGQNGQRDGAFHPLALFGHLHLPQVHRVLPTGVRENRYSMAYSHPYMNPMTWRP